MVLTEKMGVSYKKHSVQCNLREHVSEKDWFFDNLQAQIPDKALYREHPQVCRTSGSIWELTPQLVDAPGEEYGREDEPHITCLYGLTRAQELFKIMRHLREVEPFDVELREVSLFDNKPEYSVVKVDIESPGLVELNGWLTKNCTVEQTYPEYHPHMTLCYALKEAAPNCVFDNPYLGKRIRIEAMEFSHRDGSKIRMPLGAA
jgi:2'-5' RNA ligase